VADGFEQLVQVENLDETDDSIGIAYIFQNFDLVVGHRIKAWSHLPGELFQLNPSRTQDRSQQMGFLGATFTLGV
jgi:hypothetical protein